MDDNERQELVEALQRRARVLGMDVTAGHVVSEGSSWKGPAYFYVWKLPDAKSTAGADLLLSVQEKYAGPVIRLFFIQETKPVIPPAGTLLPAQAEPQL